MTGEDGEKMRPLIGIPTSPFKHSYSEITPVNIDKEEFDYFWLLSVLTEKIVSCVRAAGGGSESLFASASGDIPLVAINGAVYRMLSAPASVRGDLLGSAVGTVNTETDEPSLADDDAMAGGLSNVAEAGQTIYAVSGLDANTAVACEVGGNMRLFQRVSYAGKGPGGLGLEDTFSVRGQVAELTLSGVGTLTGDAANDAVATLLDHATLKSADMSAKKQTLTATLTNGLKLQLGVSGDTVSACGGWSCPEFFEAFESGL